PVKPRAMPEALPPAIAALSVPWARALPAPLIRNVPNRWPTPFVVSTRLHAWIVSVPASRGSELVAVPVYMALVAWNVSPPLTEHVVSECCVPVVASNFALTADTDGAFLCAAATPAATRANAAIRTNTVSRFLGITPSSLVDEPDA